MGDPRYHDPAASPAAENFRVDVAILGATIAGITAAVQLSRDGFDVLIIESSAHIGGVMTSGLGRTDYGAKQIYGGLARQLYRDIGAIYAGPGGAGREATIDEDGAVWYFEPSVAESVLRAWLDEHGIPVRHREYLDQVTVRDGRITALATEAGSVYEADAFVDASYEGDLLARAGVSYRVGRERNSEFGETANGVHHGTPHHRFQTRIDPYLTPGRPDSGLLPLIDNGEPGRQGEPDSAVQAYNFRMCLTDRPTNRRPFPEPVDYRPERYELLGRYVRAGVFDVFDLNVRLANGKTDMNNRGAVGTDHIGANHEWPDAGHERRQEIFDDHLRYTQGLYHYLGHDDSLPESVRSYVRGWGLAADEFGDTDGWPRQLYVREARRMDGQFVMTEPHIRGLAPVPDPIAMGGYGIDSHHCRRVVIDGAPVNEGDVEHPVAAPYGIALGSILPRGEECVNLAVPVCLSATHIAFGSMRMEPVFASLGQVAGLVIGAALTAGRPVQEVGYSALRPRLEAHGIVLE